MERCCFAQPLGCPTRPISPDTDANVRSVEASSAFLFSQFQYLGVVLCFNTAKPFRKSLVTNYLFFGTFLALTASSTLFLLAPYAVIHALDVWMDDLQLQAFPHPLFKWRLFALALINFAVCAAYEAFVERATRRRSALRRADRPPIREEGYEVRRRPRPCAACAACRPHNLAVPLMRGARAGRGSAPGARRGAAYRDRARARTQSHVRSARGWRR